MIDPQDILAGLENRLSDIPDTKFVEIVRLLEQIGDHPRVRETIRSIRPRMVQVRPARRLTLQRIFCDPFEDLLDSPRLDTAQVRRIDRSIITPLWQVVEACADTGQLAMMRRQVALIDDRDADARHTLGCRLWYIASQSLRKAIADINSNPRLRAAFAAGGEERLEQAREIVEFLEIGHPIAEVKSLLSPKPVQELGEAEVARLTELVQEVARSSPSRVFHLLLVAASRLRRPADLLAALADMDFGKARREKPLVFANLSGLVVSSLEDHTARGGQARLLDYDPSAAVDLAEQLVEGLTSTRELMDRVRNAQYDERLQAVHTAVRDIVRTNVLNDADTRILSCMPPAPDKAGHMASPDDSAQEQAEEHARALRRCERIATALGLESQVADTLGNVGKGVGKHLDAVLEAISFNGEDLDTIELNLSYSLRLLELVEGAAASDDLRNRALEALLAAEDARG